jgi:hypothetical protein
MRVVRVNVELIHLAWKMDGYLAFFIIAINIEISYIGFVEQMVF